MIEHQSTHPVNNKWSHQCCDGVRARGEDPGVACVVGVEDKLSMRARHRERVQPEKNVRGRGSGLDGDGAGAWVHAWTEMVRASGRTADGDERRRSPRTTARAPRRGTEERGRRGDGAEQDGGRSRGRWGGARGGAPGMAAAAARFETPAHTINETLNLEEESRGRRVGGGWMCVCSHRNNGGGQHNRNRLH